MWLCVSLREAAMKLIWQYRRSVYINESLCNTHYGTKTHQLLAR